MISYNEKQENYWPKCQNSDQYFKKLVKKTPTKYNWGHCFMALQGRSDVITDDVLIWLNINFLALEMEPELDFFLSGCEDFTQW